MPERYNMVFRLPPRLYLEGSPVFIEAGAIQKDTQTNNLLVQLKFRNISSKTMIACKVKINAYSVSGDQLEGVDSFSYLDLNVHSGEVFGSKTPIYLPNYETRKFTACVTQVVFADNSIWSDDETEWPQVSEPQKIENVLHDDSRVHDGELVKQYKIEVGNNSDYYPEIKDGLFYCTCGNINMDSVEHCYFCRREYSDLARILEDGYLTSRKDARLAREAEERRVKMQQEAEDRVARIQRKQENDAKRKKLIKIAVPVAIVLVALAVAGYFLFSKVIIPRQKHDEAMQLLASGNYDEAYALYEELGDTEAIESNKYDRAMSLMESGDYEEAIQMFESLGNYSDASQRLDEIYDNFYTIEIVEDLIHDSVYEAYAKLSQMDSSDPEVAALLDVCNQYIPYCGGYEWTIDNKTYTFYSDFSVDEDGTVYWHYDADNYGPIMNGQNSFIDTWVVRNGHVSNELGDFDNYQEYKVIVYFRDGEIYTRASYYIMGQYRSSYLSPSSPHLSSIVYAIPING